MIVVKEWIEYSYKYVKQYWVGQIFEQMRAGPAILDRIYLGCKQNTKYCTFRESY